MVVVGCMGDPLYSHMQYSLKKQKKNLTTPPYGEESQFVVITQDKLKEKDIATLSSNRTIIR